MAQFTSTRPSLTITLADRYASLGGKYDPKAVHFFQSLFAQGFTLFENTTEFTFKPSQFVQGLDTTPYYPGVNA